MSRSKRTLKVRRYKVTQGQMISGQDVLASEEPLDIRLGERTLAITMRTPTAHDFELVMGFLYNEGIVDHPSQVLHMRYCHDDQQYNVIKVTLSTEPSELPQLNRHFYSNSACGVCGTASLEHLAEVCSVVNSSMTVSSTVISALPAQLRSQQQLFDHTGGLHACALFTASGELLAAREDIGRHNAMDKLSGYALMQGIDTRDSIILFSGRSSYELLQKCVRMNIPVACSISAPSSLAYQVAQKFGVTLVGFLRDESFNVYCHPQRITLT